MGTSVLASGELQINNVSIGAALSASAKDVAAAINLQSSTTGVTATARPTVAASAAPIGQVAATISLGNKGNLIDPVTVDGGQTYYFWDKNGDGTSNFTDYTYGYSTDYVTSTSDVSNNWTDVNGNPGVLSASNRYTSINGVSVALPVSGFGGAYSGFISGTSVGSLTPSNGSNQVNPTYDGLAAIWDAYNGAISAGSDRTNIRWNGDSFWIDSTNVDGRPPNWYPTYRNTYLSADYYQGTSGTMRTTFDMSIGHISYLQDFHGNGGRAELTYVALQVLNPTTSFSTIASNDIQINGVNIGAIPIAANSSVRSAQMVAAINAQTTSTGVSASVDVSTGGVTLTAMDGRNIEISTLTSAAITSDKIGITVSGATSGNRTVTTYRSGIDLSTNSAAGITVSTGGGSSSATGLTSASVAAVVTTVTNTSTSTNAVLDLSTRQRASASISIVDSAIDELNSARSTIGSYINRLAYAGDNATNISTNLSASRSTIMDTDYAEESANLAKSQIIQQAATAMLAQANQQPQSVLALLKNL